MKKIFAILAMLAILGVIAFGGLKFYTYLKVREFILEIEEQNGKEAVIGGADGATSIIIEKPSMKKIVKSLFSREDKLKVTVQEKNVIINTDLKTITIPIKSKKDDICYLISNDKNNILIQDANQLIIFKINEKSLAKKEFKNMEQVKWGENNSIKIKTSDKILTCELKDFKFETFKK